MSERPKLFESLEPVAVDEVAGILGDDSTAERLDGPQSKSSKKKANRRNKRGKGRTTPTKAALRE